MGWEWRAFFPRSLLDDRARALLAELTGGDDWLPSVIPPSGGDASSGRIECRTDRYLFTGNAAIGLKERGGGGGRLRAAMSLGIQGSVVELKRRTKAAALWPGGPLSGLEKLKKTRIGSAEMLAQYGVNVDAPAVLLAKRRRNGCLGDVAVEIAHIDVTFESATVAATAAAAGGAGAAPQDSSWISVSVEGGPPGHAAISSRVLQLNLEGVLNGLGGRVVLGSYAVFMQHLRGTAPATTATTGGGGGAAVGDGMTRLPLLTDEHAGAACVAALRAESFWTFALPSEAAMLLARAKVLSRRFFDCDADTKAALAVRPAGDVGYKVISGVHEAFHIRLHGDRSRFPSDAVPEFETVMEALFRALAAQAKVIHALIAEALGGIAGTLTELVEDIDEVADEPRVSSDLLNLYRYAHQAPGDAARACAAHVDIGLLSIIPVAEVAGLECGLPPLDAEWIAVEARAAARVAPSQRGAAATLIVGDTLAHALAYSPFRATTHRVVAGPAESGAPRRESIVFKSRGRLDAILDVERTLRALPVAQREHAAQRAARGWTAPPSFPLPSSIAEFLAERMGDAEFSVNFPKRAEKLAYSDCILDPQCAANTGVSSEFVQKVR